MNNFYKNSIIFGSLGAVVYILAYDINRHNTRRQSAQLNNLGRYVGSRKLKSIVGNKLIGIYVDDELLITHRANLTKSELEKLSDKYATYCDVTTNDNCVLENVGDGYFKPDFQCDVSTSNLRYSL